MATVTATKTTGRTVHQVARSIRHSVDYAAELLADLEREGIAEETDGLWRLTDAAEGRFGQAFRAMSI
jgi:hypothetical protein